MMQELLLALAQGLVEDKAAVRVTEDEPNEEGVIVYHLTVAEDDMGRVIGKQGRIAKAIRVVMRAAAVRENKKASVFPTPVGPTKRKLAIGLFSSSNPAFDICTASTTWRTASSWPYIFALIRSYKVSRVEASSSFIASASTLQTRASISVIRFLSTVCC